MTKVAPDLNTALLRKVLTLIDTKPEKWSQGAWFAGKAENEEQVAAAAKGQTNICGTTACVAGWAVLMSEKFQPILTRRGRTYFVDDLLRLSDKRSISDLEDSNEWDWEVKGQELLGLSYAQAHYIFCNMDYNQSHPHSFTDSVRVYLGLKPKWGTVVEIYDGDGDERYRTARVLEYATDERS